MKNKEIKTKPKKVKINLNDWLNIANKCIGTRRIPTNCFAKLSNLAKFTKRLTENLYLLIRWRSYGFIFASIFSFAFSPKFKYYGLGKRY